MHQPNNSSLKWIMSVWVVICSAMAVAGGETGGNSGDPLLVKVWHRLKFSEYKLGEYYKNGKEKKVPYITEEEFNLFKSLLDPKNKIVKIVLVPPNTQNTLGEVIEDPTGKYKKIWKIDRGIFKEALDKETDENLGDTITHEGYVALDRDIDFGITRNLRFPESEFREWYKRFGKGVIVPPDFYPNTQSITYIPAGNYAAEATPFKDGLRLRNPEFFPKHWYLENHLNRNTGEFRWSGGDDSRRLEFRYATEEDPTAWKTEHSHRHISINNPYGSNCTFYYSAELVPVGGDGFGFREYRPTDQGCSPLKWVYYSKPFRLVPAEYYRVYETELSLNAEPELEDSLKFFLAVSRGDKHSIDDLLPMVGVDARDSRRQTPLMAAVLGAKFLSVDRLIDGSDLDAKNARGETALDMALDSSRYVAGETEKIIRRLVLHESSSIELRRKAFRWSWDYFDVPESPEAEVDEVLFDSLVKLDDIDIKLRNEATRVLTLRWNSVCRDGSVNSKTSQEISRRLLLLVEIGVSEAEQEKVLATGLRHGGKEYFRELVAKGANPKAIGPGGETLAISVARDGRFDLLDQLVEEYQLDTKLVAYDGTSVLYYAGLNFNEKYLKLLLNKDNVNNIIGDRKDTILTLLGRAFKDGKFSADLMVHTTKLGAELNHINSNGYTVLDYVFERFSAHTQGFRVVGMSDETWQSKYRYYSGTYSWLKGEGAVLNQHKFDFRKPFE